MARFRNGQEEQGGVIRRDPARLRGRRDDQGAGAEARRASADGAPGGRERDPARTEETATAAAGAGSGERGDRSDAGIGSPGAAETTPHSASDLDALT